MRTMSDEAGEEKGTTAEEQEEAQPGAVRETLTQAYERLRHSTDSAELSRLAREPLPDRDDAAAFSRATALLEAVGGNQATPLEDRQYLAATMPYPNILVKLSEDPNPSVRRRVAANEAGKSWLVGRLAKDPDQDVRTAALLNPRTSWKIRLEGAEDPDSSVEALKFLSRLGSEANVKDTETVLASMVRRAVAVNPTSPEALARHLAADASPEVAHAARKRTSTSVESGKSQENAPNDGRNGNHGATRTGTRDTDRSMPQE